MISCKIITTGKDFPELIQEFDQENKILKEDVMKLGSETLSKMHNTIDARRRRPATETSRLKNAIGIEYFDIGNNYGWGIGDIGKLKQEAPYFSMVNYGGVIPGDGKLVPLGIFYPGLSKPAKEDFGRGRWQKGRWDSEGRMFTFRAKRPIVRPLHYIELTGDWLAVRLQSLTRASR